MSNEKDQRKGSLVPSAKRGIEKYLSKLVGRGFELVKIVEQREKRGRK